jgi:hypothetical protein
VVIASNTVPARGTQTFQLSQVVPASATVTVPHSDHLYDNAWRGFVLHVAVNFEVDGKTFSVTRQVPVDIAPPVEIRAITPSPIIVRPMRVGASSAGVDIIPAPLPAITAQFFNHRERAFKGEVVFGQEGRPGFTHVPTEFQANQITTLRLDFSQPDRAATKRASSNVPVGTFWVAVRNAGSITDVAEQRVPIVWADAHVAKNLRVGYFRGFDFSLPQALNALGVESRELTVAEVKSSDLSKFSSIIVDNRVYESQPELINVNQKLLDFAQAGGNLIVFYHRIDEFNPNPQRNRPQLSPYKLILGNQRITDENAPITLLEPGHPLLNTPNKLDHTDFEGWIQERGLYYPREWDPQFKALLQSNDPGEAPLKGGLLVADYGKGHYIYTSMVWYRQLRAGVPGAYRMLANMISYGAESRR